MSKRYVVASALATASLIVAGCGGSSKSSSQTSAATQTGSTVARTTTGTQTQSTGARAPLTRTQFINKADLICARLNAIRASNKINSTQSFIQSVNNISVDEQQALQEMAQITPPAEMASVWNRMIGGYKALAVTINKIKQQIAEQNDRQINSLLIVSVKDQRKVAAIAKSAGFNDCAKIA